MNAEIMFWVLGICFTTTFINGLFFLGTKWSSDNAIREYQKMVKLVKIIKRNRR